MCSQAEPAGAACPEEGGWLAACSTKQSNSSQTACASVWHSRGSKTGRGPLWLNQTQVLCVSVFPHLQPLEASCLSRNLRLARSVLHGTGMQQALRDSWHHSGPAWLKASHLQPLEARCLSSSRLIFPAPTMHTATPSKDPPGSFSSASSAAAEETETAPEAMEVSARTRLPPVMACE